MLTEAWELDSRIPSVRSPKSQYQTKVPRQTGVVRLDCEMFNSKNSNSRHTFHTQIFLSIRDRELINLLNDMSIIIFNSPPTAVFGGRLDIRFQTRQGLSAVPGIRDKDQVHLPHHKLLVQVILGIELKRFIVL